MGDSVAPFYETRRMVFTSIYRVHSQEAILKYSPEKTFFYIDGGLSISKDSLMTFKHVCLDLGGGVLLTNMSHILRLIFSIYRILC